MTEQTNPPPQPDGTGGNPVATVLWLFVAFIPSLVSLLLFATKNALERLGIPLLFLAAACCFSSGFGVLARMKDPILRIVLGLILGCVFFVLNVIVVAFIGCSGTGAL